MVAGFCLMYHISCQSSLHMSEFKMFHSLHLNTSDKLLDMLLRRRFSEGRYCLSSKLLYLMIQLLPRLSTVHEFEKPFVWLRNLLEVCLKSISLYSDYWVEKVRFYADIGTRCLRLCMARHILL